MFSLVFFPQHLVEGLRNIRRRVCRSFWLELAFQDPSENGPILLYFFLSLQGFLLKNSALISKHDPKHKQLKQILSNKNYINRKCWNKGTRGTAIPEADFQKSSLQDHIEGSETDHIERGLQNQSWEIPRCYTVDPFIKKHWNFLDDFDFRGCGF